MDSSKCWYRQVCSLSGKEECTDLCLRFIQMKYLCESSCLPENKWKPAKLFAEGADIEPFNRLMRIKSDIENFVQDGNSLYIYSENTGNGKTSWAIKLMLAYFNQIWYGNGLIRRGLFISVPNLLFRSKNMISNNDPEFSEIRDDINRVDVVIWDDIASTALTQYDHQVLFNYIDSRCLAGKTNIFTGNADEKTLREFLGARLASRVWNSNIRVKLSEDDKRYVGGGYK